MIEHRGYAATIVCGALYVLLVPVGAGAQESKSDLLGAWESNWAAVYDLEVAFDHLAMGPPVDEHGVVPKTEHLFRWSEGLCYTRWTRVGVSTVESSFDSALHQSRRLYDPGRFGYVSTMENYAPGSIWGEHLLHSFGAQRCLLSDLSAMLRSDKSRLRLAREEVRGRSAAVLDVRGEWEGPVTTVWLDVERASVPLKWVRLREDGSVDATVELMDYVQIDGVWLPKRIEVGCAKDYVADSRSAGGLFVQQVREGEDGQPWIKVNSGLTAEQCSVNFPNGVSVIEVDTQKVYIVKNETLVPVMSVADQIAPIDDSQQAPYAGTPWLVVALLVGVGAGCALRLLKRG